MKILVNAIQLLIALAIIYPIFNLWDENNVEQFCRVVKSGMSSDTFFDLADKSWVKIIKPNDMSGRWKVSIVTYSPYSDYRCEVKGLGKIISKSWIVEDNE